MSHATRSRAAAEPRAELPIDLYRAASSQKPTPTSERWRGRQCAEGLLAVIASTVIRQAITQQLTVLSP